jgi:hypothetical protein
MPAVQVDMPLVLEAARNVRSDATAPLEGTARTRADAPPALEWTGVPPPALRTRLGLHLGIT